MPITSTGIAVALAVVLAIAFLMFGPNVFLGALSGGPGGTMFTEESNDAAMTTTSLGGDIPSELTVTNTADGSGAEAAPGDTLTVHYTGRLADGTVFDSSQGRGPFSFTVGTGQVIPGWDQGLIGMKEGGKRMLVIPPGLAYGSQDLGVIPPNSTLIFEVELLTVTKP